MARRTKGERDAAAAIAAARTGALRSLGHSGEPEKQSGGLLRRGDNVGLVYEKTARALVGGLSQKDFRATVLPDPCAPAALRSPC